MLPHRPRLLLMAMAVLWSLAPAILLAGDGGAPARHAAPPELRFTPGLPSGLPLFPPDAPPRQTSPDRAEETPGRGSRALFFAFLCLSLIPILSLAVAFALKRRFDTLSRRRASGKYRSPNAP